MSPRVPSVIATLLLLAGITVLSWPVIRDLLPGFNVSSSPSPTLVQDSQTGLVQTNQTEGSVATPPPLRAGSAEQGGQLSINGVLLATNEERTDNGAAALRLNSVLNQAAHNKLQDMFAQQYFDHVSPQGKGPADVVDATGYSYIRVGENLALGNFGSDQELVQAWMDSPGHRENILTRGYSEIGIAVGQGMFENKQTWIAVQTFGTPASVCAAVDTDLKKNIEDKQLATETLQQELVDMDTALEEKFFTVEQLSDEIVSLGQQGKKKIEQGNDKIEQGNEVYEQTGSKESADPYWESGRTLQSEGQALLDEAKEKQDTTLPSQQSELTKIQNSYNEKVDQYNRLNKEIVTAVEAYNNQVKIFNSCLAEYQ